MRRFLNYNSGEFDINDKKWTCSFQMWGMLVTDFEMIPDELEVIWGVTLIIKVI